MRPSGDDLQTWLGLQLFLLDNTPYSFDELGEAWFQILTQPILAACYSLEADDNLSAAMLSAVQNPSIAPYVEKDAGEGFNLMLAIFPSAIDLWCPSVSPDIPSDTSGRALALLNAWEVAHGREPLDTDSWILDGTWQVGVDIEPGTYENSGQDGCYWERLSGFSGDSSDVIANGFPDGDRAIVTIKSTDAGFLSEDCKRWTPTDE